VPWIGPRARPPTLFGVLIHFEALQSQENGVARWSARGSAAATEKAARPSAMGTRTAPYEHRVKGRVVSRPFELVSRSRLRPRRIGSVADGGPE
jgi:hypothetical protein